MSAATDSFNVTGRSSRHPTGFPLDLIAPDAPADRLGVGPAARDNGCRGDHGPALRPGRRRPRVHLGRREAGRPRAVPADPGGHRGVVRPVRPGRRALRGRRAVRAAAAAAVRRGAGARRWSTSSANRRPILLLSVGLVAFTTLGVGWVAHLLLPGISWPIAFAIGAVVAPAGRGRRDRDRPPDRAAPPDRDDPRGRVAAQRRHRAGRAAAPRSPWPTATASTSATVGLDFVIAAGGGHRWSASSLFMLVAKVRTPSRGPGARQRACRWWSRSRPTSIGEELHASGRHRGRGRRPAARPQGADPADRAVPDRGAAQLAHDRLRPGERGLPADRPPGAHDHRRRRRRRPVVGPDRRCLRRHPGWPASCCGWSGSSRPATSSSGRARTRLRRAARRGPSPSCWAGPGCAAWSPWPRRSSSPRTRRYREVLLLMAFTVTAGTLFVQGLSLPWVARRLRVPSPDPAEDALARATLLQQASQGRAAPTRRARVRRQPRRRRPDPAAARPAQLRGVGAAQHGRRPGVAQRPLRPDPAVDARGRADQGAQDPRARGRSPPRWSPTCWPCSTSRSRCSTSRPRSAGAAGVLQPSGIPGTPAPTWRSTRSSRRSPTRSASAASTRGWSGWPCASASSAATSRCCDSSVGQHATKHFQDTTHPVMETAEPDENWRWCYVHHTTA